MHIFKKLLYLHLKHGQSSANLRHACKTFDGFPSKYISSTARFVQKKKEKKKERKIIIYNSLYHYQINYS